MARSECSNCDNRPPPVKRKPPAEQEAATSTTPADTASLSESPLASLNKTPTQEWGIEEVIQFIESTDPCLGVHAELFRKHVSIDSVFQTIVIRYLRPRLLLWVVGLNIALVLISNGLNE